MPKIKRKQTMNRPKIWRTAVPKELNPRILERYKKQLTARQPEQKSEVEYATDRVELAEQQGSIFLIQSSNQARKRFVHQREKRRMLEQVAQRTKLGSRKFRLAMVGAVKKLAKTTSSIPVIGGGAVCLVVFLTVIAFAAVAASPFGIFFAGENAGDGSVPVSAAIAQINFHFNEFLEELQTAEPYDDVTIQGSTASWPEMLAVFAAKVAGSDVDATDVATLDVDKISSLESVFWDMNDITHEVENIDHSDSDPDDEIDDSWTERILHITITPSNAEEMPEQYEFSAYQLSAMNELLEKKSMLQDLVGDTTWLCEDAKAVLRWLPEDLSPERRAVIEAACSLVGKVNYFWGGKSLVIGWDDRWGQLQKVWAVGNSTTGTYRPFGLDCSGFVDWVFYNATDGEYALAHGGGAASQHSYCTDISWDDAQIGDLAFYADDSHVGIVAGWDENGKILIVHCSAGHNNIVITGREGFSVVARI